MRILKYIAIAWVLVSGAANAGYTANTKSTIEFLKIYNSDIVYFRLQTMPQTGCRVNYFVLSPNLTEAQRNRQFTTLLTAKIAGAKVEIGYDGNAPDCYNDRALVHAVSLEQ